MDNEKKDNLDNNKALGLKIIIGIAIIIVIAVILILVMRSGSDDSASTNSPQTTQNQTTPDQSQAPTSDQTNDQDATPTEDNDEINTNEDDQMPTTTDDSSPEVDTSLPVTEAETTPNDESPETTQDDSTDEPVVSQQGRYIDFNQADFDNTDQKRWLFFYASWCPKCRALDQDINSNLANIPSDVVIYKVNFDTANSLKRTYGVTVQTTVIAVNDEDEQTGKIVGGSNASLQDLIDELN